MLKCSYLFTCDILPLSLAHFCHLLVHCRPHSGLFAHTRLPAKKKKSVSQAGPEPRHNFELLSMLAATNTVTTEVL